jgi:trehalose/maltose hydrolase-like predicted phosphorylase
MALTPQGEIVRILSGLEEHHISADIAHAVGSYARATGDLDFASNEGTEIIVETARFWASRVISKRDGLFHIERIIGPDEYHESVDDNAFTNWMARKNLRMAASVARTEGQTRATSLGVDANEIARWEDIAAHMYLGVSDHEPLIEQQQGSFSWSTSILARTHRAPHRSTCCSEGPERKRRKWSSKPMSCNFSRCSGMKWTRARGARTSSITSLERPTAARSHQASMRSSLHG